mmetsp:Transcript_38277/g.89903  ORF Transcript_38277/g.89903 Transcript_38277/m.89903 type:complete len:380 (+) Transcript_38277:71-1210(+)
MGPIFTVALFITLMMDYVNTCVALYHDADGSCGSEDVARRKGCNSLLARLSSKTVADPFAVLEDEFDMSQGKASAGKWGSYIAKSSFAAAAKDMGLTPKHPAAEQVGHSLMQSGATVTTKTFDALPTGIELADAFTGLLDSFGDVPAGHGVHKEVQSMDSSPRFWGTVATDLCLFVTAFIVMHFMRLSIRQEKAKCDVEEDTEPDGGHDVHQEQPLKVLSQEPSDDFAELVSTIRAGDGQRCWELLRKRPREAVRQDDFGCTALHVAADAGSSMAAEALLRHGAEVDCQDSWEETPLHFASRKGHLALCELLIRAGANVNAVNSSGHTPLVEAGKAGSTPLCKALLSHGAHTADMADDELPPVLAAALFSQMMCGGSSL